jgi:hypothetical protein
MITIRLKGGLGNQMFQYAFGRAMAEKLGTGLYLDCSLLLDRARGDQIYRNYDLGIFQVRTDFTFNPKLLSKIFAFKYSVVGQLLRKWVAHDQAYVKETHFHVVHELIDNPIDNALYDGWWQSPRYFENVSDRIRNDFQLKNPVLSKSAALLHEISSINSVCLNVRRTDFIKNPTLNTTNLEYFKTAVKEMTDLTQEPKFFIFSDDIAWCEQNLRLDAPMQIVTHDHKGDRFGNYFKLMMSCKNYIIPNSTFAWWAVWLNGTEGKIVIAPKIWFNDQNIDSSDLVPQHWLRI